LVIQDTLCTEIEERQKAYFPKDTKRPSSPKIRKFLRLSKGCIQATVNSDWMKNMMNWDLYTHPRAKEFARNTSNEEKIKLADAWKKFMETEKMYISFHEWNNSRLIYRPYLVPKKASLVSCPVTTLSISDIGK
jgi:hypothetical protein